MAVLLDIFYWLFGVIMILATLAVKLIGFSIRMLFKLGTFATYVLIILTGLWFLYLLILFLKYIF